MTLSQFAGFLWGTVEPILVGLFFVGIIVLGCLWLYGWFLERAEEGK